MYRELQPIRQTLSEDLRSSLLPGLPGIQSDKLIDTYLDQLTLFVGADVADLTLSLLAIDARTEELVSLPNVPNNSSDFRQITAWLEKLRGQHHVRMIAVACGRPASITGASGMLWLSNPTWPASCTTPAPPSTWVRSCPGGSARSWWTPTCWLSSSARGARPKSSSARMPTCCRRASARAAPRFGPADQPQEEPTSRPAAGL